MRKANASILFLIVCLIVFLWMALEARTFQTQASYFPFYIAIIACILTVLALIKQILMMRKGEDKGPFHENGRIVIKYTGWLVGFIILIYIVGIVVAAFFYLFLFMFYEAKIGLLKTVISAGVAIAVIIFVSKFMELKWPSSLIQIF